MKREIRSDYIYHICLNRDILTKIEEQETRKQHANPRTKVELKMTREMNQSEKQRTLS